MEKMPPRAPKVAPCFNARVIDHVRPVAFSNVAIGVTGAVIVFIAAFAALLCRARQWARKDAENLATGRVAVRMVEVTGLA